MKNFSDLYNKNYKKILFFPALLLLISFSYLTFFYLENDALFNKDVSLTGGTTITIFTDKNSQELESLLNNEISNVQVRTLLDNSGRQSQIIVIVSEQDTNSATEIIEDFIQETLSQENSSIETTSSALSQNFYRQLLSSIALAFLWMSAVVFLIFGQGKKLKTIVVVLNLIIGVLLGRVISGSSSIFVVIFVCLIVFYLFYIYIRNSIPAFAIILSAFSNIVMTLMVVNLIGMSLSTAGIVAFLMMIGYSVDTDILLTTRVLQRKNTINQELFSAFKTGITMTLTSIIAVSTALIVVYNFQTALNQIFTILLIGLGFDIFNTWTANASIIKWYAENKK